jgi:hypothetical protein
MKIDQDLLQRFEEGLNPQRIDRSVIPAQLLGYGEISAIFRIQGDDRAAFKRMPLFPDRGTAEKYVELYREYCRLLKAAGLNLPDDDTAVVQVPGRPVVVYIAQERLPADGFGHQLLHSLDDEACFQLVEQVAGEIARVWQYNEASAPDAELALDGQISNWVRRQEEWGGGLVYIDTSTPFLRLGGVEQLDPEPLLKSAPAFLRWMLRWLFVDDVMNRYYDHRQVLMDIAANFYKEQRPELISRTIDIFNSQLLGGQASLTAKDVERYYREDKMIWRLFLAFRQVDRFLTTTLLRRRYEFILPGKVKR